MDRSKGIAYCGLACCLCSENANCAGCKKEGCKAFAKFIAEYGEEKLVDALEKNEARGMVYHYSGQLAGDYDEPRSEEGIRELIL